MFLAIDESLDNKTSVIGCLCLPMYLFADLEKEAANVRAIHRLWTELKWSGISSEKYADKYKNFLDVYLSKDNVTFHSWAYEDVPRSERLSIYRTEDKQIIFYKQSYALIRSVIKKCLDQDVTEFYIVADETGRFGTEQYKLIREFLEKDRRFATTPKLLSCTTGNSAVLNILQATDIITGCIAQGCYAPNPLSAHKQVVHDYILEKNEGFGLDLSPSSPGALYETKFHHCNISKYSRGET